MVDADVLVVGGGAIGGVTAAVMTGGVRRVMVLDANAEHVARLRDPGLRFDRLGEEQIVRLDAYADPAELPVRPEFALVTLKAAYLEPALTPLRDRASTFVSLGNGLVQDRIQELVGVRPEDIAAEDEALAGAAVDAIMDRLGATKASMLQDIERGVPTEVGVINGAVVEKGAEHGVPTPLNAGIVEIVTGYEHGSGRPSPAAFEQLAARVG